MMNNEPTPSSLFSDKTVTLCAVISFLVPLILFSNYVINHLYVYGSGVLDVGWFVFMTTESHSFPVNNPPHMGKSYFQVHFSLFFLVTSFLHEYFFPFVSSPVFFSLFIGVCYGLISFGIFLASLKLIKQEINSAKLIAILVLSILTTLNAQGLSLIGFPHIEIGISAFIVLFIALFFSGYKKLSYIALILLLSIREDAGFHLFAVLATYLTLLTLSQRSLKVLPKELLIICLIIFSYSVLAIYLQHEYFSGGGAFKRVYSGDPAFAHINQEVINERWEFIKNHRLYLYIPLLSLLLLSVILRNIYLNVGIIAVTPWAILSFFAINPMPSGFSNYYAFPFIVMLCWPVLSLLMSLHFLKQKRFYFKHILILTLCVPFLSSILFTIEAKNNADSEPWKRIGFKHSKLISQTQAAVNMITKNQDKFGNILFDEAMAALMIKSLKKSEYGFLNNFKQKQIDTADTIIFNSNSFLSKGPFYGFILEQQFPYHYRVPHTGIQIASKFNLQNSMLSKTEQPELIWKGQDLPKSIKDISKDTNKIIPESNQSEIFYGPFIKLPKGEYEFEIKYASEESEGKLIGLWDVVSLYPEIINYGHLYGTGGKMKTIRQIFRITNSKNNVEIRTYHESLKELKVISVMIIPKP